MTRDTNTVTISAGDDHVEVLGPGLATRLARLFFRNVLGGEATTEGWRCPTRRLGAEVLTLRIYDWLSAHGYTSEHSGAAEQSISRELSRRRSFERTQEAALAFRRGEPTVGSSQIDAALKQIGWSDRRALRPHQREGVEHALTVVNAANFSVPGSGKTAVALAVAATHLVAGTIDLIVVVGPVASFDPWEQETRVAVGEEIRARRVRGTASERASRYASAEREIYCLRPTRWQPTTKPPCLSFSSAGT